MFYTNLCSNTFRTSTSLLAKRCIASQPGCLYSILCTTDRRRPHQEHIISSSISKLLHSNLVNNSSNYRFLFTRSNDVQSPRRLLVPYRELPKSLCTQPTDERLKFKKINTEGDLNLVRTKTPIEQVLPSAYVPYVEIMRLNKFTGTMFLLYPCLWSIGIGGIRGEIPNMQMMGIFCIGAILMRSAGCIMNDLMDKEYDRKVERTKSRPLASGRLTDAEAIAALAALLTASLHILLSFDCLTIMYGASSLLLVGLYPLMKRFTNWPQLFLGFTFNWGTILGYSAITHGLIDWSVVLPLYTAGIFWTLIYDTIYAYQDYNYDKKLDLKSTTMIFRDNPKPWLSGFAVAMTSCFLLSGYMANQMYPFYMGTAMAAAHTAYIIKKLEPKNPNNCFNQFRHSQFVGYYLLMGIMLSALFDQSEKQKKKKDNTEDIDLSKMSDSEALL